MEANPAPDRKKPTVCVITGGLLSTNEKSIIHALKKLVKQHRQSRHHWLETKIKLVSAEPIVLSKLQRKSKNVKSYFSQKTYDLPDLTEAVLIDEIAKQNIDFKTLKCDELFNIDETIHEVLSRSDVLFISSTLLHDLSELNTILLTLEPYAKHIVVGGALAGSLYKYWQGDKRVDVLAIGYGEYLIPTLADWIKSDFTHLASGMGRVTKAEVHTQFLFSELPPDKSLDFIEKPNWKQVPDGKLIKKISYESVRGCPYRCSFCNYPYLFNDKVFRMKSAEKIAADWQAYSEEGVEYITCLDSLFTMPKARTERLCNLLIEKGIKINWTCYARADDLEDLEFVKLMYAAGARQFQIGIESGNQDILDAMNKKCTVASNYLALQNCRIAGITTVVSIIVGFPMETEKTISDTLEFLKQAKPDFHFLATFSIRVEDVPILNPKNRLKYELQKFENPFTFAPYWRHSTMSCEVVGNHVRRMNEYLVNEKVSLDGTIFYSHIDHYMPSQRDALLAYQYECYNNHYLVKKLFNIANNFIDIKLKKDVIQNSSHFV